jgi:predicted nucleic acid-binding protein
MGLTFDTGALIALERRSLRMRRVWDTALEDRIRITVPAPVVTEWWREGSSLKILEALDVELVSLKLAKLAGIALGKVRGRISATDAIVVACAAQRGDIIYTKDLEDLCRIRDAAFPSVRILAA